MPPTASPSADALTAPLPRTGADTAATAPRYDAFVSYSHAKDKAIAASLQSAVQRLGKSWHQRRALRLFRDDSSLTATPHLWPSIETALGRSRFLVLLASPEAASSSWVEKEIAWWLDHNSPETILIGLTAGELDWDATAGDFKRGEAFPLPPALMGRFSDEPLWIDLRAYRDEARPAGVAFASLAAGIAAALHGMPKEDLLSQEVRQQRRALRLAWSGLATLCMLAGLAVWQWRVAETQRATAMTQRNRAEQTIKIASQAASSLIFNLNQKFRDLGLPNRVAANILGEAYELQKALIAGGADLADLQFNQAESLSEIAQTLIASGDLDTALKDALQGRELFQELVAADPKTEVYRRNLAIVDATIGDIRVRSSDFDGALEAYRASLALRQKLAAADAPNVTWQDALAGSETDIGDVLLAENDLPGALSAYREGLEIEKTAAARAPDNEQLQDDLGVSYGKVGGVLDLQGNSAEALADYQQALAVFKALAAKDVANTRYQRDLGICELRIADALKAQRKLSDAFAMYQASWTNIQTLVTKDPTNNEWLRDLSVVDNAIGLLFEEENDPSRALVALRQSLSIIAQLASSEPTNLNWQRDLYVTYCYIGSASKVGNDLRGALTAYEQAEQIAATLYQAHPNDQTQSDLALAQQQVAQLRKKLGGG